MKRSIAAFLIVMSTAPLAWAGKKNLNDITRFIRSVNKVAPNRLLPFEVPSAKPRKTLCVCFDPGLERRAGFLVQIVVNSTVEIWCALPNFDDTTGDNLGNTDCANFDVIR